MELGTAFPYDYQAMRKKIAFSGKSDTIKGPIK